MYMKTNDDCIGHKLSQSRRLTDYYIKSVIKQQFKGEITDRMIEEKKRSITQKRKEGKTSLPKTRGDGMVDKTDRCYYYVEDGECSLDNIIVWKRLSYFIGSYIHFARWIWKKNFSEASEILSNVKENIKDIPVFKYGDAATTPISFLIDKIKKQIGKDWWEYVKTTSPATYDNIQAHKRTSRMQRYANSTDEERIKHANSAKKFQNKYRKDISEPYLVQLVYKDLRQKTGIQYTFKEIRQDYAYLIEQHRERLLKNRQLKMEGKTSGPELTDMYISGLVRNKLKYEGVKISCEEIRKTKQDLMQQVFESVLKKRGLSENTLMIIK